MSLQQINDGADKVTEVYITLFDGEIGHGEGHGVPTEDVVATVDVLPVDAESPPGQESYDPPRYICNCPDIFT